MRDPQRISEILAAIEAYWRKNPDMRLGQIVINAARFAASSCDPFYVEDAALIEGLKLLSS